MVSANKMDNKAIGELPIVGNSYVGLGYKLEIGNNTQTSPITINSTPTKIGLLKNKAELFLSASEDVKVSYTSDMASYFVIPAGAIFPIPVIGVDMVWVASDTECDLSFAINTFYDKGR